MVLRSNDDGGATDARGLRLRQLRLAVEKGGTVPLKHAAKLLNVSEMTIRRDLAAPGATLVCLGGYIMDTRIPTAAKYALEQERDQHAQHKLSACRHAAKLVNDGDTLFIDCGTTMPHLAENLPRDLALTVVCYSMNVATIITERPNTQVIMLGGVYHASSASFYSDEALQYLKTLGLNKAFISAGGVHPTRGASCSNFYEVPVKQAAIASAIESILVIDESKLARLKPAFFAGLDAFTSIVVGGSIGNDVRKQFKGSKLVSA
jgi:DeoR family deoxyribose operon repressor